MSVKYSQIDLFEFSHIPRRVGVEVQRRIDALKIGQRMQDLPEELWHESFLYYVKHDPNRCGGPNLRIIRLDPSKPSLTVTGYIFNKFVHPFENRFITPREAARLQGFPDDFLFHGTLTSVQRQVGNAVPAQLSQAVANKVLQHIEQHQPMGLSGEIFKEGCIPALSLFSGAGGMDLGLIQAKRKKLMFDIRVCIEHDHDCCETLRKNFGGNTVVLEENIERINPKDIIASCGLENGTLPIIIGGPPCQSFSQAGKQRGMLDPRGTLIFEFLRFVKALKPTYFIMENVANLRGISGGALLTNIQNEIEKIGYNYTCNMLCAADFGSPQLRRRLVFVGVKKPYPAVQAPFPSYGNPDEDLFVDNPYVGVGKAFEGLPILNGALSSRKVQVRFILRETINKRSRYRTKTGR